MSRPHYLVVEDGQIEMSQEDMEVAVQVPLPPNSMWFTTAED